jgi:hypothetical protein
MAGRSSGRQQNLSFAAALTGFDERQPATMKVATVNQESRAKAARRLRVFKMQSLRSGVSPKAIGFFFFLEMQSLSFGSEASSMAKGILYRKALRTDLTVKGGLVPIAFGADSVAFGFASPPRARPLSGRGQITTPSPRARSKPELSTLLESGTF